MRVNFRQGIVQHQLGGFLTLNGITGNVDLLAANRPTIITLAHHNRNYLHEENGTVTSAWVGPFLATQNYWLYWNFNLLTFARTFGFTTLEPVSQSAEPGNGDAPIIGVVAGGPGVGAFIVDEHFVLQPGRLFGVIGSTGNNGNYTVFSATFNGLLGQTTIVVNETVPSSIANGAATLDIDAFSQPLLQDGRMWYDTQNNRHYERMGSVWVEVLRVFAAQLVNGSIFIPQTITIGSFIGTQIGDTSSVRSGRVLFDEASNTIIRDDRTFFTTEDQFFTSAARVDALRLESNVARAKANEASMAAFKVVTWTAEGVINTGQYEDIATSVVGLLTEDLLLNEVGAVIIQGVITNPDWDFSSVGIGSPLWTDDNGELVSVDPHVTNVLLHPIGRVPIARVLARDTIIFEQGLGGKGDPGPPGSITALPPATTTFLGAVTLVTPSSNANLAFVISDTDPRLSNARVPLPHTHVATEVLFTPGSGVSSNNVQGAIQELGDEKVDIAGDTMTGFLTLNANPTQNFHAATKLYVDSLVSGLIWLDPICVLNLISDTQTIPPISPVFGDAYVIPPGAVGVWAVFIAGHIVTWDGSMWIDMGALTGFQVLRFGISFTSPTPASGSYTGQDNKIVIYNSAGNIIGFETPVLNNAIFVCSEDDLFAFNQFAFNGSSWVLFGGGQAVTADNITTVQIGNTLQVKQFGDGGINDVKFWQGLEPSDLNALYAPIVHTHPANVITFTPYTTSPNWGTISPSSIVQLNSVNVQAALQELEDEKAPKTPFYASQAGFPAAATVHGMLAFSDLDDSVYFSSAGSWVQIASNNGAIQNHDHTLPYDITFFVAGPAASQSSIPVGQYVATRNLTITGNAANLYVFAKAAPTANVTYDVLKNGVIVGTITILSGQQVANSSTVSATTFTLVPTDRLELRSPAVTNTAIEDLSISIVACGTMGTCP